VQFDLAECYQNGAGVDKNEIKAVEWYERAADQEHAQARFNLGVCYEYGIGVYKDEAQAVEWYRRAAARGHINSQLFLKRL